MLVKHFVMTIAVFINEQMIKYVKEIYLLKSVLVEIIRKIF